MKKVLFGCETNARILFYLLQNKKCYPREIAQVFAINYNSSFTALSKLEKAGILRSYHEGRTHLYRFDKDFFYLKELKTLLKKLYKKLPRQEKIKYYENKRNKNDL